MASSLPICNLQSAICNPPVALVGAGPGHPGLVTLRAVELLRQADFVLYDRLVSESVLDHVPAAARKVCVEELGPCHAERLPHIQQAMIDAARQGLRVVRLKGGDPMVFGRGGEEADALRQAGIDYEIVPGVTAALGVASCAAIPLTHRRHASAVAIVAGHEQAGKPGSLIDWAALARFPGTLVFYMGLGRLETIARSLIEHGKPATTPAAAVERATTPRQRTVTATLTELPTRVAAEGIQAPALVVVGDAVALRERIAWFEGRPLFGKTVLVTRPRHQAGDMVRKVEALGGQALVLPAVEIRPPDDWGPVDRALARLGEFSWLAFTSANGVGAFLGRLRATGRDLRALGGLRLAAIGPATADALRAYHLEPDLVPQEFNSEGLAAALRGPVAGGRVLLARADRGLDLLREELSAVAEVEQVAVYSQRDVRPSPDSAAWAALRRGEVDYVSLTSSNIARALLSGLDEAARQHVKSGGVRLVSISPRTSAAVRELGYPVAAEAAEYTTEGVLAAMVGLARAVSADP
ncbi:MAG: uroporphyrinogen-III C-methyltransferase [Gemmataceae bacterium]